LKDLLIERKKENESMSKEIFDKMIEAVADSDGDTVVALAQQVSDENMDPIAAINDGLTAGMKVLGERFSRDEVFLPEMMLSAGAVSEAVAILEKKIPKGGKQSAGKIVLATVEGDIHYIGKDFVAMLLGTQGIDVYDLGVDVSVDKIVDKALEVDADIIGTSSLLTMTVGENVKLVKTLEEKGLRDKYKIMMGGAAVTEDQALKMGADAYGEDGNQAVVEALRLLKQ
jgi:trimethylamine corrinoid protein